MKYIKIKYYLRGLGTGIVITTLVLTISFNVRSCTAKSLKEETTTEETTKEKTTKKETTTEETTTKETTTEETTMEETTTEEITTEETTEETTTKKINTETYVTFSVVSGMSSDSVAQVLADMGVVEDARDFNLYLCTNGYDKIIRVGTYEVKVGAGYEEIARLITN